MKTLGQLRLEPPIPTMYVLKGAEGSALRVEVADDEYLRISVTQHEVP